MGKITARGAYLAASYGGNASMSLACDLNSITLTQERDAPEATTFCSTTRERLQGGISDWSMAFEGFYDNAILGTNTAVIDEALFNAWSASINVVFGPGGSVAGGLKYTGSGVLSDYEISWGLEDAITISGTIESRSGSIVFGTF